MIERVRITSETDETKTYVVTFVGNEPVACTCPSYHFRATECKHLRAARDVKPPTLAQLVQVQEILRRNNR
jgi:hypothetical protein